MDQDKLKAEHAHLINAFREKSRKHEQTQELYARLKRKEMTAATQSAAFESVDEVLQSASGRQGTGGSGQAQQFRRGPAIFEPYSADHNVTAGIGGHGREGSGGSGRMMPPPLHRPVNGFGGQGFRSGIPIEHL